MLIHFKKSLLLFVVLAFAPVLARTEIITPKIISPKNISPKNITLEQSLAQQCFVCHGLKGEGVGKIPELRGLEKSDIVESLLGFKSRDEKSTVMKHYADAYTRKEIELLAEYFSTLEIKN